MRGILTTTSNVRVRKFLWAVSLVAGTLATGTACKGGGSESAALYRLETPALALAAGASGDAKVRFVPADGYHWNPEFPARLKVSESAALTPDKNDFSLSAGDFKDESGVGSLSIRVAAKTAGATALKGLADFSVCNDKECRIFKQIAVEVPVNVQ